jgi:hypothetical protein
MKFEAQDIADYETQEKILEFYELRGKLYSSVNNAIQWMISYRINAIAESRTPWSDNFTRAHSGDLSIVHGCFSMLYVMKFADELPDIWHFFKQDSIYYSCLKEDLARVMTGHVNFTAASDVAQTVLKTDDDDPIRLKHLGLSPSPYIEDKNQSLISTENYAYLIRICTLLLHLRKENMYAHFVKSMEEDIPGFFHYVRSLLRFLTLYTTQRISSQSGLGPFMEFHEGYNSQVDLYHTHLGIEAITEYFRFFKDKISEDEKTALCEVMKKVKLHIVENQRARDTNIGWNLSFSGSEPELNGSVYAILALSNIYTTFKSLFDCDDIPKIVREVMNTEVAESFQRLLALDIFNLDCPLTVESLEQFQSAVKMEIVVQPVWGIRYSPDDNFLNYIRALVQFIQNFDYRISSRGKIWSFNGFWEFLYKFAMTAQVRFTQPEVISGFCFHRVIEGKPFLLASLKSTTTALNTFHQLGLEREARSGIIDIISDTLKDAVRDIVNQFYMKFSDLESLGYRIAWQKIKMDHDVVQNGTLSKNLQPFKQIEENTMDEFTIFLEVENLMKRLRYTPNKRTLSSWKAEIRNCVKDGEDTPRKITMVVAHAEQFNENVEYFISDLVRTTDPEQFKLKCSKKYNESIINGIEALFDPHKKLLDSLMSLDGSVDLKISAQRLMAIKSVLENVVEDDK